MAEETLVVNEKLLSDLLDEDQEATEYSIETNAKDGSMRIQFHNDDGVLSSFITDAPGAYELAQRILCGYDRLEGI